MSANDDELLWEIAQNAAEHAAWSHGKHKDKRERAALYQAHFDSVLAGLMVFAEIVEGRNHRRQFKISNN